MKYLMLAYITLVLSACGAGGPSSQAPLALQTITPDDQCSLPYLPDYPDAYLGIHPIPAPSSTLSSTIVTRSISLKTITAPMGTGKTMTVMVSSITAPNSSLPKNYICIRWSA